MDEPLSDKPPGLPVFLRVIGSLSVINGVYGLLSSLVNAISPVDVDDRLIQNLFQQLEQLNIPFEHLRDDLEVYYLNTLLNFGNIAAASFMCYGISLLGALMMLRRKRTGFWLYGAAQVGLAFVPSFFGGLNSFGWTAFGVMLVWNGLWVGMYASQLRHLDRP